MSLCHSPLLSHDTLASNTEQSQFPEYSTFAHSQHSSTVACSTSSSNSSLNSLYDASNETAMTAQAPNEQNSNSNTNEIDATELYTECRNDEINVTNVTLPHEDDILPEKQFDSHLERKISMLSTCTADLSTGSDSSARGNNDDSLCDAPSNRHRTVEFVLDEVEKNEHDEEALPASSPSYQTEGGQRESQVRRRSSISTAASFTWESLGTQLDSMAAPPKLLMLSYLAWYLAVVNTMELTTVKPFIDATVFMVLIGLVLNANAFAAFRQAAVASGSPHRATVGRYLRMQKWSAARLCMIPYAVSSYSGSAASAPPGAFIFVFPTDWNVLIPAVAAAVLAPVGLLHLRKVVHAVAAREKQDTLADLDNDDNDNDGNGLENTDDEDVERG